MYYLKRAPHIHRQQLPTPKGPILIKFSLKKDVVIDR